MDSSGHHGRVDFILYFPLGAVHAQLVPLPGRGYMESTWMSTQRAHTLLIYATLTLVDPHTLMDAQSITLA